MKKPGKESYVLQVLENTQRYAQSLLSHNERLISLASALQEEKQQLETELRLRNDASETEELRARVSLLDIEKRRIQQQLDTVRSDAERHRTEREELQRQVAAIRSENERFLAQYMEVEQQNSNLANLYVASYRLHATLNRDEVLATIQEIIINLVGCEEFVVFELDEQQARLSPVAHFGVAPERLSEVHVGTGPIGRIALEGDLWIGNGRSATSENDLTACIPLKLDGRVTGVIALYRLLDHKPKLESLDHELFELLATHAAPALYCTSLYRTPQEAT